MILRYAAVGLMLIASAAYAQVKCTMANGVVTAFALSDKCPDGAIKIERNGVVTNLPRPAAAHRLQDSQPSLSTSSPSPSLPTPPLRPEISTAAAPKQERNIIDEAFAICYLMRKGGATTCDVKARDSHIDATMPTTPSDANGVCTVVSTETRKPGSPFIGRDWQLKIFSPYGQDRPIAACAL